MSTIAILSLSAVIVTGLAAIHETRLRRAVHHMLRHLIRALAKKASRGMADEDGE